MSDPLDIVTVSITSTPQTPAVAGFGTGLLLAKNTVDPGIVVYTGLSAVSLAGYGSEHPVYLAASTFFAQTPHPSRLKVAGLASATPWAARITTTLPAVGTVVELDVKLWNGTTRTATYTVAAGNTAINVAAALGASLAGFAEFAVTIAAGQPYFDFAAATGTKKHRVSRMTASLSYLDKEPASGYETRLSELALIDQDFYAVMVDSTSPDNIAAVFLWSKANGREFFALTQDTVEVNTAGGGPLAVALRDLSYDNGELRYNGTGIRADAAMASIILANSWDAASSVRPAPTFAFRNLAGVPVDPLTPSQVSNAQTAVNLSLYVRNNGANITWQGKAPGGQFADLKVFLDWLGARVGEGVYGLLVRESRLLYTDLGIGKVVDAVYGPIRIARDRGGVSPDFPLIVTGPKAADISVDERSGRILGGGGIVFSFVYTGGIHKVRVNGVVTL